MERASIDVVGYWIQKQVVNEARPKCVNFISWRFSPTDVTTWFSKAGARTPLQNLPFKGYIQASHTIGIQNMKFIVGMSNLTCIDDRTGNPPAGGRRLWH